MRRSELYTVTDMLYIRHDIHPTMGHRLVALLGSNPEMPMVENVGEWDGFICRARVTDQYGIDYEGELLIPGSNLPIISKGINLVRPLRRFQ